MNATRARWFEGPSLELVLESRALRRANGASNEARARMQPWVLAAERRYRAARELRSDDRLPVALGLLRDATRLALGALRAARGEDTADAGQRERWTIIDEPARDVEPPAALVRVREAFAHSGALEFDSLSLADARALRLDAEIVVEFLLAQAEVRTPERIRRSRIVRIVLAALVAVLTIAALIAYVGALRAIAH